MKKQRYECCFHFLCSGGALRLRHASSRRRIHCMNPKTLFTFNKSHAYPFLHRVTNESSRTQAYSDATNERSESDKIVDGMDFVELCNDFECTARQLVRDILELRQRNRALGTYSVSVKYKDPVRVSPVVISTRDRFG